MNIADYGKAGRESLLAELVTQCDFLAAHHVLLAGATADRERVYWKFYDACDPAQTVSARDKTATSASLAHVVDVIEVRGEVEAYKVRIALLRDLLTYH